MTPPHITDKEQLAYLLPEFDPAMLATIQHPGKALAQQSDALATALINATESSPRMRKWLEAASQPAGVLSVAVAILPVATSARVWYAMVTPRYRQIMAQVQEQEQPSEQGMYTGPENNGNVAA
jgi:hypothetical protein